MDVPWQGKFDMFCGIYAASHLVMELGSGRVRDQASVFRDLIASAEALKLLSAKRITDLGFSDRQIARIFNGLSPTRRRNLRATPFSSSAFKEWKAGRTGRQVIGSGCGAIIQQDGDCHWIAALRVDESGQYDCYDSWSQSPVNKRGRINWGRGVLIGPNDLGELN
ncbi:MAG: hypothetical protein Q8R81_03895 [Novosphingobium sp.]|uniref:hypothetical protein n=1 Tax=Novosphingobium sp. TaxID=1874826 RepID=UPI002732CCF5|nr:hypothetical protein [Novosphingobium sp.]MDP3549521.1 hypothetical protein [Novosphingobium sp.]